MNNTDSDIYSKKKLVYYYNVKTSESRWKRPKLLIGQSFEDIPKIIDTSYEDAKNWDNTNWPNWKVIFPEDEGGAEVPYWWNCVTGESSYTAPVQIPFAIVERGVEIQETEKEDGKLAYPWSKEYDGEGLVYYYNAETSESQWELPDLNQRLLVNDHGGEEEDQGNNGDGEINDWEECDDGQGGVYFFSWSRQESTWNDPQDSVMVAE
jgi:hypothetical protein